MAQSVNLRSSLKALLRRILTCKSHVKKHEALIYVLRTRAWGIYSVMSLYRVIQAITKTGHWYEDPVDCSAETFYDCIGRYNEDMLDPIDSKVRFMHRLAIGASVVLCLLAYRWRFLADFCLYFEAFIRLCAQFFPNQASQSHNPQMHCMIAVGSLLLLYSDSAGSMLFLGICLAISIFISYHVVWMHEFTIITLISDVCLFLLWLVTCALVIMAIAHVTELHGELSFTNSENKKLLDTIHEGMLVYRNSGSDFDSLLLQSSPKSVMFCNQKARKLLSQHFKGNLFTEKVFCLTEKHSENSYVATSPRMSIAMSLEEIIAMQKDEPN